MSKYDQNTAFNLYTQFCHEFPVNLRLMIIFSDIVDLDYCDICKFVAEEIENALKKNETIPEIEAEVDKLCNVLPDTVSAQVNIDQS